MVVNEPERGICMKFGTAGDRLSGTKGTRGIAPTRPVVGAARLAIHDTLAVPFVVGERGMS